jgi:hypothetical protein
VRNLANEEWCSRRGCGHMKRVHTGEGGSCEGINVVGEPNVPGADQHCQCPEFTPMEREVSS